MTESTLYDRLGGRDGIGAVVDEFYDRALEDELLGPLFAAKDLDRLRRLLTEFLCDAAGGPERYDGPGVREAHLYVPLEPVHVERAVELLEDSLDASDVPEDDAASVVDAIAAYQDDVLATVE